MRQKHAVTCLLMTCLVYAPWAQATALPGLPAGMCPLNSNVEAEKVVFDYLKAANEGTGDVLAVFGECGELKALEAGKQQGLRHYGYVLRQTQLGKLALTRADYLATAGTVYANNPAILSDALGQAQDATGNATQEASLSSANNMQANSAGVLHQDANLVVMGVNQTHEIGGKQVAVASTVGLTLIDGDPISVNLYAPASDKNARTQAVSSLTAYGAKLVAANP